MNTLTTILCITLPFIVAILGSATIYLFKNWSKTLNIIAAGLASGIMLSASIWSLLVPAVESSQIHFDKIPYLPILISFTFGGILMILLDFLSKKLFKLNKKDDKARAFKLFSAITIHNIPEGLSLGFAIGSSIANTSPFLSCIMFSLGIAMQNFPEGLATTIPLHSCLKNKHKAFGLSVLSAIIEPIFAIAGFFLASSINSLLPWLLSLSAGSMMYVVVEELLPEIHQENKISLGTWTFLIGFILMMLLDIYL